METSGQTSSCEVCSKTFSKQADLDDHLEWHNLQIQHMQSSYVKLDLVKIFKCNFCTRGFLDHMNFKQHQKKYFERDVNTSEDNNNQFEKPFKCDECGWRFVKESTLESHSILHKPFPHKCECGIGYYKKWDLDIHMRLVHPILKTVYPSEKKIKTEKKIKYKPDKTESESEPKEDDNDNNYRPKSKLVGPRLRATLKYKQERSKTGHIKKRKKSLNVKKDELGNYVCQICAKTCMRKSTLEAHMNIHNGIKYKCDECPKEFHSTQSLYIHQQKHSNIQNWECRICKKKLSSKASLKQHMVCHTGERPHPCHLCPKSFTQSGALKIHLLIHTGVKNFKCEVCNKKFYTDGSLKLHQRVHTGEKPYECERCGKCFSDPSSFKRHKVIHTGLKPHQCKLCPKAFCDPSALYCHMRRHQGWNVSCAICKKTFRSFDSMQKHVKIAHTILKSEDKYECDYCGKEYSLKQYLALHITVAHLKTVSLACDICGKVYHSRGMLNGHLKQAHLRVKDYHYKCNVCDKTFPCRENLKRHKSVHDKKRVRKYECDDCCAAFFTRGCLRKHIVTRHLGIKCKECKLSFATSLGLKEHKSKGCIKCSVCNLAFFKIGLLRDHYAVKHSRKSEREVYECDYCHKQFPLRQNIRQHIKFVHGQRIELKLYCDHCTQTFSNKKAILDHIWSRHLVCLYCNVCMKRFYNETEFQQHKRVGCNLKQLPCDICEKVFKTSSQLRSHLMVHSGKTHQCDMCGKTYQRRNDIFRHIQRAHGFRKRKQSK